MSTISSLIVGKPYVHSLFSDGRHLLLVFDTVPTKLFKEPLIDSDPYTLKSTQTLTYKMYASTAAEPEDFHYQVTYTDTIDFAFTSIVYSTEMIYQSATSTTTFYVPVAVSLTDVANTRPPLNFGTVDIPSFVYVTSIEYTALPPISQKAINFSGRPGAYDYGIDIGQRTIKANIQIVGVDENDVIKKTRLLADWLYSEELQPLIIGDEPDKVYMARIVGDTDISEIFRVGQGTIEFICPNAFAESLVDKTVSKTITTTDDMIQVLNEGNVNAYPVIELTMKQDSTGILVVSDEAFVQIGDLESTDKVPDSTISPIIYSNKMDSTSGWTNGISVDYGTVAGDFVVAGNVGDERWDVLNKDYGTGSTWHGPSKIKSLSEQLQDFEIFINFGLQTSNKEQVGRVDLYLLDANNVQIGKVSLVEGYTAKDLARFDARIGTESGGRYMVKVTGTSKNPTLFNSMDWGRMLIRREGRKWTAKIGRFMKIKGVWTLSAIQTYSMRDSFGQYMDKVAKVQVHVGAYKTYKPVNSIYVSHLSVQKLTTKTDGKIPIALKNKDVIVIDNDKAEVLRNGAPVYDLMDPSSDFISLNQGYNGLVVSPPIADIKVTYRERWL